MRRDARIDEYARLLVDRSIGVQPRWQVLVRGNHLGRPLIQAVVEQVARRGAYPILQLCFERLGDPFQREAPLDVLRVPAPIVRRAWEEADAVITVYSPEDAHEGSDLSRERLEAVEEMTAPLRARTIALAIPWVIAEWPVESLAAEAGMTLEEYEAFIFGAVLLDWDAEAERMRAIAALFDATDEVRIEGTGTDLTLSIRGRAGIVDDGHVNMPGGEVFYGPIEDSAQGVIEFAEFPAVRYGTEMEGVRLVFEQGRVVEATARTNEDFLRQTIDTDAGARAVGELGIGCNPGIQRFMKNVGFDEKIGGTIHLALGSSYPVSGGTNVSSIHWDIVKDLRANGRIHADGRLVQENGAWRF